MYKVLLVDDENWVVESLKASINWEENGFRVVGQACSGLEALELIEILEPDVVFTDIRMPGVNGLELIKKSNDLGHRIQYIVASGYAEFAYVQKALNYGAVGYCLKPFDENEIIGCLNKAKKTLQKESGTGTARNANILENIGEAGETVLKEALRSMGIDADKEELLVAVSIGKTQIVFPESVKYVTFKSGNAKWAYIFENRHSLVIMEHLRKAFSNSIKGIGIGPKIQRISTIQDAIDGANTAAYGFFITGREDIYEAGSASFTMVNKVLKQLDESIRCKDLPMIESCFNCFARLLKSSDCSIRQVFHIYNMSLSFVFRYVDESHDNHIDNYEQLAALFENSDRMLDYLKEEITKHIGLKPGYNPDEVENKTVKDILQYVNANFHKEMSVQSLSKRFYINPNYISQIFKKEVGLNFTEYLTQTRIDYACRLLKESRLSVQQVSEKAGYNDYFYFTRIFKKTKGKTPSEYRNTE